MIVLLWEMLCCFYWLVPGLNDPRVIYICEIYERARQSWSQNKLFSSYLVTVNCNQHYSNVERKIECLVFFAIGWATIKIAYRSNRAYTSSYYDTLLGNLQLTILCPVVKTVALLFFLSLICGFCRHFFTFQVVNFAFFSHKNINTYAIGIM